MAAWVVRYALFAYGNTDDLFFMLLIGIALHGLCYDFFFVSGQIYTDSKAGKKIKSAAQGLITLATYGIGMLIGFWVAGIITDEFITGPDAISGQNLHEWKSIWLYPAGFAGAVFILFLLSFKDEKVEYTQE